MKKTLITLATAVMMFLGATAPFTTIQAQAAEQTQTMDSELLHDINQLRAEQGLPALTLDNSLNDIAEIRSNEIIDNWSHTRPDGTSGCDMISADNYRGENLSYISYDDFDFSASDQTDAADSVFSSLKDSPAHYNNMVNSNYTKVGIRTSVSQTSDGVKLSTAYMFSN
ncbi:CAP domain-containing protein [Brotaphodocola sp.]|uniref:CAP domain-containing protein n=1 Tax=Brotaphodocola sp. TaxID=3073577 RepID=UPI003D7E1DE8